MKTKRLEPLSFFAPLTLACAILASGLSRSHAQDVTWIPDDGIWKYYDSGGKPPADGSGNSWLELDFDDTLWRAGAAELGFGDSNPAQTTLITRGPISFYFRHKLDVSAAQLNVANQLVINLIRDDGAVVYVNGTEIRRDNMPGMIGDPVGPDDLALAAVAGNDEANPVRSSHLSSDVFIEGENIVAVQVHQNKAGSSDISFEMEMLGFEVVPVLGIYTPPAPIDFDGPNIFDGLPTVEPGLIEYSPLDAFEGDPFILGFWATNIGGFNTYVFDKVPATQEPLDGFSFGQALVINKGSATVVSDVAGTDEFYADNPAYPGIYRVDLSNFKDVKLQFDMRTFDNSGAGLSSSSRARTWIYTSVDGSDPMTEELVMDLQGAPAGGGTAETLVSDSDSKRVLVPDASTSSSWRELGFNDSTWTVGTKAAGYDRNSTYVPFFGPTLNLKSQLDNIQTSLYMRVPFTVSDPSDFTNLILNVRYDDGFAAYLNGTLVASANAPGAPGWDASATGQHGDGDAVVFQPFNLTPHIGELVAGNNVLAIHGMNDSVGSSDMLTGVEMVGIKPGNGNGTGEPENLTDISGPIDGDFHTFSYDIPDQMNTVSLKWTLNCNDGDNAIIIDNFLISGTPIEPNTFANWIALTTDYQFDGLGAPDADPDGDLIPNLLEYAFGGSASVPERVKDLLPSYQEFDITGVEGNTFRYPGINWRQLNLTTLGSLDGFVSIPGQDIYGGLRVRDIIYTTEISFDGVTWDEAGPGRPISELVSDPEETEDVTIDYSAYFLEPLFILPGRIFVRIKVILDQQ